MEGERQPTPRVELYVRSLQPDGYCQQQTAILDRIATLVSRGIVAEQQVHVCGCQVPASRTDATTTAGDVILTRLSEFHAWADRNGCTLAPAIETRDVRDSLAGSRYRAVRLPALLLAEFRGDELHCVTPHCTGETTVTVPDRVSELESGDPREFESLPDTATTVPPRRVERDVRDTDDDPVQLPGQ